MANSLPQDGSLSPITVENVDYLRISGRTTYQNCTKTRIIFICVAIFCALATAFVTYALYLEVGNMAYWAIPCGGLFSVAYSIMAYKEDGRIQEITYQIIPRADGSAGNK